MFYYCFYHIYIEPIFLDFRWPVAYETSHSVLVTEETYNFFLLKQRWARRRRFQR